MTTRDTEQLDYLLVGGGLQAGLITLALAEHQPAARVAVIERGPSLGGNHTWCFHAGDLGPNGDRLVSPLVVQRWGAYDVHFPRRSRTVSEPYAVVTSERLADVVGRALARPGCTTLTSTNAVAVEPNGVVLDDGRRLSARLVIDARGPGRFPATGQVAYQKFLGLELSLSRPHRLEHPVLMDARVPQTDGFRFFYVLPLSADRVLVEDTYFSDGPTLDSTVLQSGALSYAAELGLSVSNVVRRESGVLPLPSRTPTAPARGAPLLAGYQGGWFHPTTGYSFPAAMRLALHVATRPPEAVFDASFDALVREHARQQRFFSFLNRLLFGAFEPEDRWNVLERFYGLPEPTIRRFYAMTTTTGDRTRILCGRPPRGLSVRAALARGAI